MKCRRVFITKVAIVLFPGPGMPGNGKGQGVHNLELHREQEERLRSAGRAPWAAQQEARWYQEEYAHQPPFRYSSAYCRYGSFLSSDASQVGNASI